MRGSGRTPPCSTIDERRYQYIGHTVDVDIYPRYDSTASAIAMAELEPMGRYDVLRSYDTREPTLGASEDTARLGQKNLDHTSTRTKITQVELGRLGIIGTVLSVTYGTWQSQAAACITLKFDFRCKDGALRFERSEISLSFAGPHREKKSAGSRSSLKASKNSNSPAIVFFYPQKHDSSPSPGSQNSSMQDIRGFASGLPFTLKGRTWSKRTHEEPHQVFWTMEEDKATTSGISDEVCLCVIVRHLGPFLGTVKAQAKLAVGITMENTPWSRDDPLLFDGITGKGPQLVPTDYDSLGEEHWALWLSKFGRTSSLTSSSGSVSAVAEAPTNPHTSPEQLAYRIRAIPARWSGKYLLEKLIDLFEMDDQARSISIVSFTPSAFPGRDEKNAVVLFLRGAPPVLGDGKHNWVLGVPDESSSLETRRVELVFDRTFEGFTPLGTNSTTQGAAVIAELVVSPHPQERRLSPSNFFVA